MADLLEPVRVDDIDFGVNLIQVTGNETEAELIVSINNLNAEVKRLARRGKIGTLSAAYNANHIRLSALITELEAKRGPAA